MLDFTPKTQTAFGLDVSGSSIKIMELAAGKRASEVRGFTECAVPKGAIINDMIADEKTMIYLLRQSLDKPRFGHIGTPYAVVSLSEAKSFVRVIQIPKMSEAEADNAVPYEAESFIPMPLDQVYLDWQRLSDDGEKMNILIIASPKDYVDKYLELLDKADIRTLALEVESQSCHRAVVGKNSQETSMILDMSAGHSSMIMVEQGSLQFTSTIPIAGASFTESIAKALGVASAKAEEIKCKVGLANTVDYPNIKTSLLPVLNNLSAEIKNILKFHSEHSANPVSRLWLVGGSSRLKNLPEFLASQFTEFTNLQVGVASPWSNIPNLAHPPLNPDEALSYVTAIGLAMRGAGIN